MGELNDRLDTNEGRLKELEGQYEEIIHNTELSDRKYERVAKRHEGGAWESKSGSNVSSTRME